MIVVDTHVLVWWPTRTPGRRCGHGMIGSPFDSPLLDWWTAVVKLAEALLLRSDLKKKLASLRERVAANALVQEKEKPHEDPAKLIKEAVGVLAELEAIGLRIDAANQSTRLPDGRLLAAAIAHRDTLAQHHSLLNAAIAASRKEPDRYSMKEIKWIATLEVAKLQKQCDDLAKALREINAAIQSTNWQADIA